MTIAEVRILNYSFVENVLDELFGKG
jgi:hypothetical protein